MTILPTVRMTVDQFLPWAQEQSVRYELVDGVAYAMTPQQAVHAEVKFAIQAALASAIRARKLACHMLPDGMTVRIDDATAYEPDALVYCGPKLSPSSLLVPNPVIVVEVLSPSTARTDALSKLPGYFRVPSIAHYLIVDPNQPLVIHHARGDAETLLTRIVRSGTFAIEPPGLELDLGDIYPPNQP